MSTHPRVSKGCYCNIWVLCRRRVVQQTALLTFLSLSRIRLSCPAHPSKFGPPQSRGIITSAIPHDTEVAIIIARISDPGGFWLLASWTAARMKYPMSWVRLSRKLPHSSSDFTRHVICREDSQNVIEIRSFYLFNTLKEAITRSSG